jgi:MFS family permease
MIWPLKGDADRLTTALAVLVAVTLGCVILAPNLTAAFVMFTAAGVANSLFFAATLAARSEYAPIKSRGQVFIWVGALKIAAGSAGTAVAGALVVGVVWLPVAGVIAAIFFVAACCLADRSLRQQRAS